MKSTDLIKWTEDFHPFLSIMGVSLLLGLVAGIHLTTIKQADGKEILGLANVIGAGFSGIFTSIAEMLVGLYNGNEENATVICICKDGKAEKRTDLENLRV